MKQLGVFYRMEDMPITSAFGRQRQEDEKFKIILSDTASLR